jgi:glycosyltransferase involved in cell wall biosynthesis
MQLALVLQSPPSAGGANHYEKALHNLVKQICDKNNITLHVFSSVEGQKHDQTFSIHESKKDYFKLGLSLLFGREVPFLKKFLRTDFSKKMFLMGIDYVYFASPNKFALDVTLPKIITTVWDLGHRELPTMPETGGNGRWFLREIYYRRTIRMSTYVVTDSEKTIANLERFYGSSSESMVSIGLLPVNHDGGMEPPIFGYSYFLYPAQRWRHKNHSTIIRALKLVIEEQSHLKLVLTGTDKGEGRRTNNLVKRLGLSKAVVDLGFVEEKELVNLEKYAVALLMPSLLGPTNIPPLDALNLGTPVIISDVHEFPPEIQSKMVVVPALDHKKWAEAMIGLLSKPRPVPITHSSYLPLLKLEKLFLSLQVK